MNAEQVTAALAARSPEALSPSGWPWVEVVR
jgi:hypothetical protein